MINFMSSNEELQPESKTSTDDKLSGIINVVGGTAIIATCTYAGVENFDKAFGTAAITSTLGVLFLANGIQFLRGKGGIDL